MKRNTTKLFKGWHRLVLLGIVFAVGLKLPLSMASGQSLPPNIHFRPINPTATNFSNSAVLVRTNQQAIVNDPRLIELSRQLQARIAAVRTNNQTNIAKLVINGQSHVNTNTSNTIADDVQVLEPVMHFD